MPLGIEQNNHLLSLTLDVWQDQIFFNDSAFPAGYFAADILNVGDETMQELLIHGGEISFQVEALANAEREEFIKLLPETRASLEKMLDALWKCSPYNLLDQGKELHALDVLFDPGLVDELLKQESPIRQFFFRYLTVGFSIPLGIDHQGHHRRRPHGRGAGDCPEPERRQGRPRAEHAGGLRRDPRPQGRPRDHQVHGQGPQGQAGRR